MKRSFMWISVLVLVAVLATSLVGCSSSAPASPTAAPPAAAATKAPAPAATTASAPAAPAATTASTAAAPAAASSAAVDRIKKAGKLVVLIDSTFAPMEFVDEKGETVGFDIDMANAIAKELGVKAEFQTVSWDGIFAALLASKGDMIMSSVDITAERQKSMAFSDPYFAAGQVILVPADNTTIKGPDDLKGKVVAVQIDTTGQEAVEKIAGVKEIKKFDGGAEACLATETGKTEVTVIDLPVAADYVKKHTKVKVVSYKPFVALDMGIAMRPADTDLVKKINEILAKLKSDGTTDKAMSTWGLK